MISSLFLNAAIRSVLLAVAVWISLRIFRVRNVLAQKVAWGLVLAAALAMPIVLPMAAHWSVLPANVRVVIPADPQTLLEELRARIQATPSPEFAPPANATPEGKDASPAKPSEDSNGPATQEKLTAQAQTSLQANADADADWQSGAIGRYPETAISQSSLNATEEPQPAFVPVWRRLSLLQLAGLFYLAVAGVLCARLIYGLLVALHVLQSARPVLVDPSRLADGIRLLVSDSVSSPVTIGSAVVLPKDYCGWDSEKLRVVLAHEGSHVRQGDFYLQLLVGLYSATVWFSPLGWWLKRKLSDLAEAISDRAGLEEAADHTSYAQILLEFAAAPRRPTLIGVAMARSGSISHRIERLLNEVSFRQAFAGTRRAVLAVLGIPVALFAVTALVRVQAAGQDTPQRSSQAVLPVTGVVSPDIAPAPATPNVAHVPPASGVSAPQQVPGVPDVAPVAPPHAPANCPDKLAVSPAPSADAPPAPRVMVIPGTPGRAMTLVAPKAAGMSPMIVLPRLAGTPNHAVLALIAPRAGFGEGHGYGVGQSTSSENGTVIASRNGRHFGYHYWYSKGDAYAVVRGNDKENLTFSGNWIEGRSEEIDKARKQAGGKDFLWFTRDGKAYFVDDPATLAQIEAMYKPMEELGRQQEELGKEQEALGKQQEELGRQQEAASVPTPDMSKEIAKIEEAMAKLKASQGKNMTQDQFADLQEKLGELQSRIGEIQGQIGEKQGEFGAKMGELGSKMGALGAQMGELGTRQGMMAKDADQKVRSIINESLKNGKAKPVQ